MLYEESLETLLRRDSARMDKVLLAEERGLGCLAGVGMGRGATAAYKSKRWDKDQCPCCPWCYSGIIQ